MENNRKWRSFGREEIAFPVRIRDEASLWKRVARPLRIGSSQPTAAGRTENLSPSGLCLRMYEKDRFKVGQEVSLSFGNGNGGPNLRLMGRIVWTNQNLEDNRQVLMGLQITRFLHRRYQEDWYGILLSGGSPKPA